LTHRVPEFDAQFGGFRGRAPLQSIRGVRPNEQTHHGLWMATWAGVSADVQFVWVLCDRAAPQCGKESYSSRRGLGHAKHYQGNADASSFSGFLFYPVHKNQFFTDNNRVGNQLKRFSVQLHLNVPSVPESFEPVAEIDGRGHHA